MFVLRVVSKGKVPNDQDNEPRTDEGHTECKGIQKEKIQPGTWLSVF
jgi:hypothetical protein